VSREDFVSTRAKVTVIFDLPTGEKYTLTVPDVVDVKVTQQWRYGNPFTSLGVESLAFVAETLEGMAIQFLPLPDARGGGYFSLVKDLRPR